MRSILVALSWLSAGLMAGCGGLPRTPVDPEVAFEVPAQPPSQKYAERRVGMDAKDLVTIAQSEAMLAAERILRDKVRRGEMKIAGRLVTFEEVSAWSYTEGLAGLPASIAALDGKKVTMIGFMQPIEDLENIQEFVLVGSLWACCFGQPPDTNGFVRVRSQRKLKQFVFDPIQVEGVFRVSETVEEGFCLDIFQIDASSVKVIKLNLPKSDSADVASAASPSATTSRPRNKYLDEADRLAQQDAEAMLASERRLQADIAAGRIQGVDRFVGIGVLSDWNYVDGLKGMPAAVRKLDGTRCMMAGFMLPVNRLKKMSEFVLVQSMWACCYGQPPDTHEMVRVVLPEGLRIDHHPAPVKIIGKLRVRANVDDEDGFCLDVFQLDAESVVRIAQPKAATTRPSR